MSAQPKTRLTRPLAAALALCLASGGAVVAASAPAGAYPSGQPMRVTLDAVNYTTAGIIEARVTNAKPGCRVKVTLSGNNEGGSATEKVQPDGTLEVDFDSPAPGTGYRITATVVSSSCKKESDSATFNVLDPTVTGPKQVSAGSTVKISATGFPPSDRITWKVFRNGRLLSSGTTQANSRGASSLRVEASRRGNYSVRAASGKFKDSWAFAAS